MSQQTAPTPAAIVTLCDEHRHMNMLVETLDEHLEQTENLATGDYFLMQDIVRYMHDYSDTVHHPTEDLMFDKLVRRNPAREKDVARLRREHGFLDKNTLELMKMLELAAERQSPADAKAVLDATRTYIRRLRRHMNFEEAELFPSASRCLASKDWHDIEARLEAAEDPLFGDNVKKEFRVLYEFFSHRSADVSRRVTNFGFLQLDNMIVSADVIEAGISEMWDMLRAHGSSLEQEFQSVAATSAERKGIASKVAKQATLAGVIGKTAVSASSGAVGIYFRTLKGAAVSLVKGAQ